MLLNAMTVNSKEEVISDKIMKEVSYLAKEIVTLEKQNLVALFPYLLPALSALVIEPVKIDSPIDTMATDGAKLYYNPKFVIRIYKENIATVKTILLHEIFHCMFMHMTREGNREHTMWNIATDIAINYIIKDINTSYKTQKNLTEDILVFPNGGGVELAYDKDKNLTNQPAEAIYAYLVNEVKKALSGEKSIFDNMDSGDGDGDGDGEGQGMPIDLDKLGIDTKDISESAKAKIKKKIKKMEKDNKVGDHTPWKDGESEGDKKESKKKLEDKWTKVNKEIKVTKDMDKEHGNMPGGLSRVISDVNKGKLNWKDAIRNLANSVKESEKEDVNSVDFRYLANTGFYEADYSGDIKVVNDFIIAVDTSGSIDVNTFRTFMAEIVNIFKTIRRETTKVNFYVIQCDTRVTDVKHVKRLTNIDELNHLEIKGGGGTNFVPVFDKVDDLIRKKLVKKLKGIMFFTDGYGEFPTKKPKYETLWVFADKYHIDEEKIPFGAITVINKENL